ncbi:cytochrome b [Burkholderia glumae]|uniref:cytochrome b n=1 Tax=Burkholderia glumae TaxID=337 RepID=UPI000F5FD48A|nr:cytochrome b [Burkholderia glumae]MCQ0030467.1 cytochrome b [Burkholderia glumae]MCQ0039134.1 cytochrome b [Burkholderia glumae]MCR1768719.1 cytochrome b [Burkholderia glumae]QHP92277.1 cytochrome b [Burkholderia glumae]QJW78104.1 cytochrome b [Burkholderia glumae]
MNSRALPPASDTDATARPVMRYTRTAMVLHWLIALGILANVAIALSADAMPDGWVRPAIDLHKSIGITVLGLAVLRLLWRATHRPPALPGRFHRWERRAAHLAHVLLYLLMFAMPITGWLHDSAWKDAASHPLSLYHLIPWFRLGFIANLPAAPKEHLHTLFGEFHTWGAYALYAVLAMHILGALKHELLDRESVLRRMLP